MNSKVEKGLATLIEFVKAEDIILFKDLPSITEVLGPEDLELKDYFDMAKKLGCKIIYCFTDVLEDFNFDDLEEEYREDFDEESELVKALDKGIAQIKRRWNKYMEKPKSLGIMWVYNGIGHTFNISEDWANDLKSEITKLQEQLEELEAITPRMIHPKFLNQEIKDPKVKAWQKEFEDKKDEWSRLLAKDKLFNEVKNRRSRFNAAEAIVPGFNYSSYVECPGYGRAYDYLFITADRIKKEMQIEEILELKDKGIDPKEIALLVGVAQKKVKEVIAQAEYQGN